LATTTLAGAATVAPCAGTSIDAISGTSDPLVARKLLLLWMTRHHPVRVMLTGAGTVRVLAVTSRSDAAVQLILELAAALDRAAESVALNQARMDRIAAADGVTDAPVAVLPNLILAAGGRGTATALDFISIGLGVLVGHALVLRRAAR
jgi:hypothetical protein